MTAPSHSASDPAEEACLPDWPRAHGGAPATANLRSVNADFVVEETLGFAPDGDGEQDLLWVEKEGHNTERVAGMLANFAGIHPRDVGYAGMKDRHAVTRQWFSVRRPGGTKADWRQFGNADVRILEIARHRRKLRRGAHRGNRFRIVLRDLSGRVPELEARLAAIRDRGVPNYFGEQRFGHAAGNLELARQVFGQRRVARHRRSLALSTARAWLFNHILELRVLAGSWDRLLPGDCANLDGSGSLFPVERVDAELDGRTLELDLHPTGALWGRGGPLVAGDVALLEQAVAERFPVYARGLEAQGVDADRRALRARVMDLHWEFVDLTTLRLQFSLGRGAYATAVLRELVRSRA